MTGSSLNGYPGATGGGRDSSPPPAPGFPQDGAQQGAAPQNGAPQGGGYGPPVAHAAPGGAPPKGKGKGLYIGIGCCLLAGLLVAILAVVGGLVFLGGDDDIDGGRTTGPVTTEPSDPTDPATTDPTDPVTTDPSDPATTDPTDEPTVTSSISVRWIGSNEASELESSSGEKITPTNGTFISAHVEITNDNDVVIGISSRHFRIFDDEGVELSPRYGEFTTAGPQIPAGESAEAQLWVDVEPGTTIGKVTYTDEVGTQGHEVEIPVE